MSEKRSEIRSRRSPPSLLCRIIMRTDYNLFIAHCAYFMFLFQFHIVWILDNDFFSRFPFGATNEMCAYMKCIPVVGADSLIIIFILIYLRNCAWNREKCTECYFPMVSAPCLIETNRRIAVRLICIGFLSCSKTVFFLKTESLHLAFFFFFCWDKFIINFWMNLMVASPLALFFFFHKISHTKLIST